MWVGFWSTGRKGFTRTKKWLKPLTEGIRAFKEDCENSPKLCSVFLTLVERINLWAVMSICPHKTPFEKRSLKMRKCQRVFVSDVCSCRAAKGLRHAKKNPAELFEKKPPSLIPYSSGVLTLRRNRCRVVLCPVKSQLKHCDWLEL